MFLFSADGSKKRPLFLYYRKLHQIKFAVLHCLNTNRTWIGKQLPAGVARFFCTVDLLYIKIPIFATYISDYFQIFLSFV